MTESALYDAVTGLPTRELFLDRLAMALRGAERSGDTTAVVLLQLDPVEVAADLLAPEVARRLSGTVRAFDSVGRLGADCYAILLQGQLDEVRLRALARRILFELSPPFEVERDQHFLTARLGGTIAQTGIDGPEALMDRAVDALAEAQLSGAELFVLRGA